MKKFEPITVAQLISALTAMPQDAEVEFLYDGSVKSMANAVWVAKSGTVIIAEVGEDIYDENDRPKDVIVAPGDSWDAPRVDETDDDGRRERVMDWQPIDTAPKDETEIDLWLVSHDWPTLSFREADCRWEADGGSDNNGFGWTIGGEHLPMPKGLRPTHWMHKPKGPPSPA